MAEHNEGGSKRKFGDDVVSDQSKDLCDQLETKLKSEQLRKMEEQIEDNKKMLFRVQTITCAYHDRHKQFMSILSAPTSLAASTAQLEVSAALHPCTQSANKTSLQANSPPP